MTYNHLNGIRALQTQTTTGTASAASQTGSDAGVGGDDTSNNGNIFGGNGSAPLVPAFILTGFLLAAILLMTWWRRVARPAGARMPFARVGGGMFYFPAAFDGPGAGPGGRREREKDVGPKPEMFDVLVRQVDKKEREEVDEKGGLEWEDVKPLATRYEPSAKKTKNKSDSNANDRTTPLLVPGASALFHRLRHIGRPHVSPTYSPSSEKDSSTPPPAGQMHITVLISMPSPSRPRYAERHSSETVDSAATICVSHPKGKERSSSEDAHDGDEEEVHLSEFDLVLGFTTVPFVAGAVMRNNGTGLDLS